MIQALLYRCENQTLIKEHERRIETAEMKFVRPVAGYGLYEHETNERVREELNT
jgi:hypothetical protein